MIDRATRFGLGLRFAAIGVVEFIDFGRRRHPATTRAAKWPDRSTPRATPRRR
jgi:hypothetical protein